MVAKAFESLCFAKTAYKKVIKYADLLFFANDPVNAS